jgi:hypothetical protein
MAVFPCDYCRRRYRQAQQSIYYTEVSDHLVSTWKVRLCPNDFDLVTAGLETNAKAIEDAGDMPNQCEHCGGEKLFSVSVRVFKAHAAEQQYVAELCASCASALGNTLRIYNGSRLADR